MKIKEKGKKKEVIHGWNSGSFETPCGVDTRKYIDWTANEKLVTCKECLKNMVV